MTTPVDPARQADSTAVVELTQYVYDTIISYLESCGIEVPKRRSIVIAELVVDDNEGVFGVIFGGTHVGPPGGEIAGPIKGDAPRTAVYDIELWRKVSTQSGGGARARRPAGDAITDQAKTTMKDTWALQQAAYLCDRLNAGVIATTAPLPPEGGLQGVSLSLQLQVP